VCAALRALTGVDAYTKETREWLDRRFAQASADGVYLAHQPIYGFDAGHCEPSLTPRYVRTLEIMRALAQLRFDSCLDVGAAEGYKAELVHRLFGARVVVSDLSENACRRAREIYGLTARPGDVHELPFESEEFDVALCSETLEHVSDVQAALSELLRVARKAVVITVPNESERRVEEARAAVEPHAHIHSFGRHSLDFLTRERGLPVVARPIVSPMIAALGGLVEGTWRELREPARQHRAWNRLAQMHNAISPVVSRFCGARAESRLLELDRLACRRLRAHLALLFVVLKDRTAPVDTSARKVTAKEIVSFRVPFHYLDG
jgi:ubiquinone/menaquinone biosynthesis C-methylase UbiE